MNAPPPDRIPLPLSHGGRIRSARRAPGTPERNAANGKFSIAIAQTFTLENWRTALNISESGSGFLALDDTRSRA
jgi:hypothetical protein